MRGIAGGAVILAVALAADTSALATSAASATAPAMSGAPMVADALPETADAPLPVGRDEWRATVTLVGARPRRGRVDPALPARGITYADALGDGVHLLRERRARDGAVEDWITLPRPLAGDRVGYRVDVTAFAGIRLVRGAETLELLDASGAPRLRMEPPSILDRGGRSWPVHVVVRGCSFDTDPRPPWGRPVVPPGARECEIELRLPALSNDAYPAVLDPAWTETAHEMTTVRAGQTATRLESGLVLVVAGRGSSDDLASAELFDPETETFAITGSLGAARRAHTAARLEDGRVLVVGGYDGLVQPLPPMTRVDRYDPTTGEWTELPDLAVGRAHHTMTVLADGRVLVIGGYDDPSASAVVSVEMCAKEGTPCRASTPMGIARADHSASRLPDGRVLVAGGAGRIYSDVSSFHATTAIFDPSGELWADGPPLPSARIGHVDVVLPNGRVLFFGGARRPQGELLTSEVVAWDPPATPTMTVIGDMKAQRWLHTATLLASGRVLVTGTATAYYQSSTLAATELFDPVTRAASAPGSLLPLHLHTSTLLLDGRVLITGGGTGGIGIANAFVFTEPAALPSTTPTTTTPVPTTPTTTPPTSPSGASPVSPFVSDAGPGASVGAPAPSASTSFYACSMSTTKRQTAPIELGLLGVALAWSWARMRRRR